MTDKLSSPVVAVFAAAAERFKVEQLREHQFHVCLDYYNGRDSFFIAPTGFGKSLVYQIAPLVLNAVRPANNNKVLVVMPTIALIDDSIQKLTKYVPEMPAVHLTPATITKAKAATYIFTSPEMILSREGRDNILTDFSFMATIGAIFVDECHIIDEWGQSHNEPAFREQYSRLGQLRSFTKCPVVAMTATINYETIGFIKASLNMDNCNETKIDIEKKNISYHLFSFPEDVPSNFDFLVELIRLHGDKLEKTLVFFTTIPALTAAYRYIREETGQDIGDEDPIVAMYTSLTCGERKKAVIDNLNSPSGTTRVVLCTSSLAVGVNVASVKYVIHYGCPTLSQDFVQESGRGGREANAHCHSIMITFPNMNRKGLSQTMKLYIQGKSCRRETLLKSFGSSSSKTGSACCCDVCNKNMNYSFQSVIEGHFIAKSDFCPTSSDSSDTEPSLNELGDAVLDSD